MIAPFKEIYRYLDLPVRSFRRLGRIILGACHDMGNALIMLASATLYIRTIWKPRARHETAMQLYVTSMVPAPPEPESRASSMAKPTSEFRMR